MIYSFENCELDEARVILRRDGVAVHVEPQVFDLLRLLIDRRGHVVRKEELLDLVWGDRFVSESALTSRIKSARQAVGDDGTSQRVIRTVHGRGYEFVAELRILEPSLAPVSSPAGTQQPPLSTTAETGPSATRPTGIPDPLPAQPSAAGTGPSPEAPTQATGGAGGAPDTPHDSDRLPPPPSRLPAAVQTLIGRDELLKHLVSDLGAHRLVTLAGPGGVGKTSLGFELARLVEADYVDGVYAVELVTVIDEDATFEAFATALDVNTRLQSSVDDAIVDMLRPRRALLLLDNCEHLVDPLATLVNRILRAAPNVSIVTTSREPLAVAGEHVWTVEPLPVADLFPGSPADPTSPAGQRRSAAGTDEGRARRADADADAWQASLADLAANPAVALFVERARAVDPAFSLDDRTAPAVAEICRRLDGIPLAIELAAARARAIDVTVIAERLDERFRFLKAIRRGTDPRHRTLHDAISWSYDLLTPDERHLFAALATFAGPFDLDDAEAVCEASESDDVLDLLTRLTERSMLAVRRPPSGGTRYELLDTLRQYGRNRLDQHHRIQLSSAHAAHFAEVARAVEADMQGPAEDLAVSRADASFADLRAAQRFALQVDDLDTALGLVGSIREYSMRTMRYEVFAWAEAAARWPGAAEHPAYPLVSGIQAYGAWVRGEYDTAAALARSIRDMEEQRGLVPSGLVERVLGNVLLVLGDAEAGMAEVHRLIELAEASGVGSRVAHACYMASVAASSVSTREEAAELAARARAAGRRTGSATDLASASVAEGFATQDDEAGLAAFATADRLARAAGNRWMSAFARTEASGLLVHAGHLAAGCAGLAELVDTWYRAGDWSQQWVTLARCIIALDRIDQPALGLELVGAVEAHAALGTPPVFSTLRRVTFETRDALCERVGAARAEELCRAGASKPVVDLVHRTRNALLGRQPDG